MMGAASRTGSTYPSRIHKFTQIFSRINVVQSLVYIVFCRSLFVFLSFRFLAIVLSVHL